MPVGGKADSCRILVVENSDDFRAGLGAELKKLGHDVTLESERCEAIARDDLDQFDLLVSDLVDHGSSDDAEIVRSFKLAVTNQPGRRAIPAVHDIIERTLSYKLCCIDTAQDVTRALDDGRDALARELSDTYADEALRAITTAGLPPAAPRA